MNKSLKWIVIAVALSIKLLVLSGFVGGALEKAEKCAKEAAIKNLKLLMKYPDSMRLTSFYFVKRSELNDLGGNYLVMCGTVDMKNSSGTRIEGNRFVSINNATVRTRLDDGESRATLDSIKTEKPATVFEKVDWNPNCVDALHPPTYTGRKY